MENESDNPSETDAGAKNGMPRRLGWAAGIICFCVAFVTGIHSIYTSPSSTAAVGYIFLPFAAAVVSVPAFAAGWCLGYFADWHRSRIKRRKILAITAGLFTVLVGIRALKTVRDGLNLSQQVYRIQMMDATALEAVLDRPDLAGNKFILGAIAQNPNATAAILHRIAISDRPDLHEPMRAAFDVLGKNNRGLAVMRLVAGNPNTASEDVERLAASTNEYVRGDVAANPKLSEATLRKLANDGDYLVDWGLAHNRQTPWDILSRLAGSGNEYTRFYVAANPSTPRSTVELLTGDADERVREAARAHIQRH